MVIAVKQQEWMCHEWYSNAIYSFQEEEPLNSEDDVSDEDQTDFFDTDNVVVCQYDKVGAAFLKNVGIVCNPLVHV